MSHPAIKPGATAVITGGASGLGLAAALRFAQAGLNVALADVGDEKLAAAAARVVEASPKGRQAVLAQVTDVREVSDLQRLRIAVDEHFGGADILMNNAGIQLGSSIFTAPDDDHWERILSVNLKGVIQGSKIFGPGMMARGRPGLIINTGSKQGITTPPGDPAYNVSKAAVKAFTEALDHELRNQPGAKVRAHLFIPGFVFTPLSARGRTEKPEGAWTPEQTVDFMLERLGAGDFYILCPDNDTPRALDERRIAWAAGDIIHNRPALSRWHPDYADAFAAFVKQG